MSVADVANRAGVHERTVWRHIRRGKLASMKLCSARVIPIAEARKFIDGKTAEKRKVG